MPLLAALAACGPSAPAPDGGSPTRVVSLSPAISRLIVALGAGDLLVGVDRYSLEHPDLANLPSLGGLFAPDLERTVELGPDLVVGVESAQQRDFFAALRARGVRCEPIDTGGRLDQVLESWTRVGALLGREAEARALIARVSEELAGLRPGAGAIPPPSVALVVDAEPLYVVGGGGFVHDLIEAVGARNAFGDLDAPYPRVSLELLAGRAPDVILDGSLGDSDSDGRADARRRWLRLTGAARVGFLPRGSTTLPGPDLVRGAQRIREALDAAEPAS